jgi:hypothetical protein
VLFGTLSAVWTRLKSPATSLDAVLASATTTANTAAAGLWGDLGLYALSGVFALVTATTSNLLPHRAWGTVAQFGYAAAAIVVLGQLLLRAAGSSRAARPGLRFGLTWLTWSATTLLPLVWQAVDRAGGRTDRAQDEVLVIEAGGHRLLETGTPYLDRAAIAALPDADRLLAYLPYQPVMAVFGLPRALDPGAHWWTDARLWFAVVTVVALVCAVGMLARAGGSGPALVRALQMITVLPLAALTLATGGDDLPVLALCLLALALGATRRLGWAGVAVGVAASLKLFAWPVVLVLGVYAFTRRHHVRYALGAFGLPILTALPALLLSAGALAESVLAFPFGQGLVHSPAASPLPGHLVAAYLPGGAIIAAILLLVAGVAFAIVLTRRPPITAGAVSRLCGYGMLAATLLLPSTRFGYLLYPVVLLVWAPALRLPKDDILFQLGRYSRAYRPIPAIGPAGAGPWALTRGAAQEPAPAELGPGPRPPLNPSAADEDTQQNNIVPGPVPPSS